MKEEDIKYDFFKAKYILEHVMDWFKINDTMTADECKNIMKEAAQNYDFAHAYDKSQYIS
jgi:hypothetical protein